MLRWGHFILITLAAIEHILARPSKINEEDFEAAEIEDSEMTEEEKKAA